MLPNTFSWRTWTTQLTSSPLIAPLLDRRSVDDLAGALVRAVAGKGADVACSVSSSAPAPPWRLLQGGGGGGGLAPLALTLLSAAEGLLLRRVARIADHPRVPSPGAGSGCGADGGDAAADDAAGDAAAARDVSAVREGSLLRALQGAQRVVFALCVKEASTTSYAAHAAGAGADAHPRIDAPRTAAG
eukprot:gene33895-42515_t